jgi:DNA-directed RNA polymerase I subunit RPA43
VTIAKYPDGTHSLSSPSHLSLLFAKTFNISIPLQHIPQDLYKFEHTDEHDDDDSDSEAESDDGGVEEVGRWRNTETGLLVGEEGKKGIKFTVIGYALQTPHRRTQLMISMQVNNNVLSLTGSLLADPTNPPAPPSPILPTRLPSGSPSPEPEYVRPAKQARPAQAKLSQQPSASAVQPAAEEVIDDRFLSARELKAKRKAEEKAKRDARKARKEDKHLEEVEEVAAGNLVKTHVYPKPDENLLEPQQRVGKEADIERDGLGKRKAAVDEGGEGAKKRKVAQV